MIRRLGWGRLLAVAGVALALAAALTLAAESSAAGPPRLPWTTAIVMAAMAGVALVMGWRVRDYQRGRRPGLDPLVAARTAMFAQASAYSGAALAGAYAGYVLALAGDWGHEPRRELVVIAAGLGLVAAGLVAAGWAAERWCATDDDGDGDVPEALEAG